jgi:hypothetical protein
VKTGRDALSIVQVNYSHDNGLTDPDQLLERYFTLTGWSEALHGAGAGQVTVVQRFHRNARLTRRGIDYIFTGANGLALARMVAALRPDIAHVNALIFPGHTWLLRRAAPAATAIVVQNHCRTKQSAARRGCACSAAPAGARSMRSSSPRASTPTRGARPASSRPRSRPTR